MLRQNNSVLLHSFIPRKFNNQTIGSGRLNVEMQSEKNHKNSIYK